MNHKNRKNSKIFGYEVTDMYISSEEANKIRRLINSNNRESNINLEFVCNNMHEKSINIPKIDTADVAYRRLYMIFVLDENGKSSLVFKTVFYGSNDEIIMITYEIGNINV